MSAVVYDFEAFREGHEVVIFEAPEPELSDYDKAVETAVIAGIEECGDAGALSAQEADAVTARWFASLVTKHKR